MAAITVFGAVGSGSIPVEATLTLLGIPYDLVEAVTWMDEAARRRVEAVNPMRQVPALVLPSGEIMTESAAILIHLGLVAPEGRLLPQAPAARAQAIRGLVFIAANCYAAIGINDYPERWTAATAKSSHEKLRQGARGQLHRSWEVFADTFAATPWLSGSAPGALDYLAAVVSKWAGTRAHLAAHRPALLEVLQKIEAHETVAPIFGAHWPA